MALTPRKLFPPGPKLIDFHSLGYFGSLANAGSRHICHDFAVFAMTLNSVAGSLDLHHVEQIEICMRVAFANFVVINDREIVSFLQFIVGQECRFAISIAELLFHEILVGDGLQFTVDDEI